MGEGTTEDAERQAVSEGDAEAERASTDAQGGAADGAQADARSTKAPDEDKGKRRPRLISKNLAGVAICIGDAPHDYDCIGLTLVPGDRVLVDGPKGPRLGTVVTQPGMRKIEARHLRRVIRRVSNEEEFVEEGRRRDSEAYAYCGERIRELNLPMKLVRVEYAPGGGRCTFFFSSEQRVDFRALVRDLARQLRTRIEMRQIGVRDQAKVVGGLGVCGRELCCCSWIGRFAPVSIRMAKDQGLALNPQKVSGVCGRLLCCLTYEEVAYKELRHGLPKVGKRVRTPLGEGKVRDVDVLGGRVRVFLEQGMKEFGRDEISPLTPGGGGARPPAGGAVREPDRSRARDGRRDERGERGERGERSESSERGGVQGAAGERTSNAEEDADGRRRSSSRRRRGRGGRRPEPGDGAAQTEGSTPPTQAAPGQEQQASTEAGAEPTKRRRPRRRRRRRKKSGGDTPPEPKSE